VTSRKTLVSVAIILAIGLHAAPLVLRSERGTLWQFMQWSMYKNSRAPGPVEANQRRIIAITAGGRSDTVTPRLLGLSITVLEQRFLRPMAAGDSSAAPILFERLNADRRDSVIELRFERETYTVTDTGIVRMDNPVVTYRSGSREPR
jgi:hypothetical protein